MSLGFSPCAVTFVHAAKLVTLGGKIARCGSIAHGGRFGLGE
jgi:hypothetical protein